MKKMENILVNENVKNLIKEKNKMNEISKKIDNFKHNKNELYYKMHDKNISFEEYKTEINNIEKEQEKMQDRLKLQKIKVAILQNNVTTNIQHIFETQIFEKLLKYDGKNIGEVRKKEIETICEETLENYGIIASVYLHLSSYSWELAEFSIRVSENYTIEYSEYRKTNYKEYHNTLLDKLNITINKEKQENGIEKRVIRYLQNDFIVIENYETEAKRLLKEYKKANDQIKRLSSEIKHIREAFNGQLKNNIFNELYIDNIKYL